jgi:hypothetical protein
MPFFCINCDHNATTILANGDFDPAEVCFVCIGEEAIRIGDLDGEAASYVLDCLIDSLAN